MQSLRLFLLIVLSVATMASCTTSRKKNSNTGQVIIIKDSKSARHGGYKKGWTKNPNNPHHPHTTNPGHTKHKKGKDGGTVIIVNNNTSVKQASPKGKPGKGGHHKDDHGKGKKGGKGKN
ncbi:hypothetical protein H9Q13_05760 [Pontibacter sp. JH31]|uniref:Uncharacterized protein n=1 Tax=Pontibacter aquaedesilientis TaxID=2766980 RepID=A0ABR7XEE1_9BACT|nr:hypothetical protein [Pontibacter aquaedesilientis]MBD1396665.1 hypothetical protein [Pontibacter aquaedesilientis]